MGEINLKRTVMTDEHKVFFPGAVQIKEGDEKTGASIERALERPEVPLAESTPEEGDEDPQVPGLGDARTSTANKAAKKRARK